MSTSEVSTDQNGCHTGNAGADAPAPQPESSPFPAKNTIDQNPADLSLTKKDTELNGNAQSEANGLPAKALSEPSISGKSENTSVTEMPNTHSNGSQTPAEALLSQSTSDAQKSETISKSVKSAEKPAESGADNVKSEECVSSKVKTKKDKKREAKSSKKKKSESKSQTPRQLSAMDGSDAIDRSSSSVKVNGQSSKEKRERKRKPSETSDAADSEVRSGKRVRLPHMPFQHPAAHQIPQYYKNSIASLRNSSRDSADDKIVVFNRGEFLAVRNDCDSFYICRTTQNVYKTSRKFKIQWLQNEKNRDQYKLDFMDQTDFECVLTNLRLNRLSKEEYELPADEKQRLLNILQRAINVERGVTEVPDLKQVAADGIDVSIVGKKEEKELLELEAKKTVPPVEPPKAKSQQTETAAKTSSRVRKMSTESSRSSRKSEASLKENSVVKKTKSQKVESRKEPGVVKSKKKEVRDETPDKSKKLREKRSASASSNGHSSTKSKDQVLVEKIVGEIVKKHKIEQNEKEKKKKKKKKQNIELKSEKKEKDEKHRSSRLTRNSVATAAAATTTVPAAVSPVAKLSPPHHETIRGLVNLLNSFSSSSLRVSTLNLLERMAQDYPKDCLPFLVETLLTHHRTFLENDDGFVAGPHFPRRHVKDSPPKSKTPKSLFQMYFHQKMLSVKMGTDREYDRSVVDYYSAYYSFIVSICKIGIKSDFVSGDLVSLCSTVALESLPTGIPVFVALWSELIDAEEKGQESQFLEVLGHCPNFRNYVIAILNQERKFLSQDSHFELAKRLASKVKSMSSLTQKLVSSRSLTLISDISKDYPSVEAVKDPHVFVTVLRALNLSLLYTSSFDPKTIASEKILLILKTLRDKYGKSICNGESAVSGSPHNGPGAGDSKAIGNVKSHESRTSDSTNKISDSILSILRLLDVSKC